MLMKEKSERNTLEMVSVEEINVNVAYRWFLGYMLNEPVPHFATISYNFRHRFTEDMIETIFTWILFEAHTSGYLSPEVVFIDGTHIKANENINDRKAHGKKPFDDGCGGTKPKERKITVSGTKLCLSHTVWASYAKQCLCSP